MSVLKKTAVRMVRAPALMTIVCKMFLPCYARLAEYAHSNGLSERLFFCLSTTVLHISLYFGMNSIFLYWDRNGIFEKYKLDRTKGMGPSEELIRKTKIEAAVGQALIGPVTLWFIYPLFKYFGSPDYRSQLPPTPQLFCYFLFAFVFNDFFFYWAHRTVHSTVLYKWIHKQHHEYKGTIGFAAEYASPLEQVFANQLPTIGGCLLSGAHLCVLLVWLAARMEETYGTRTPYRTGYRDLPSLSISLFRSHSSRLFSSLSSQTQRLTRDTASTVLGYTRSVLQTPVRTFLECNYLSAALSRRPVTRIRHPFSLTLLTSPFTLRTHRVSRLPPHW